MYKELFSHINDGQLVSLFSTSGDDNGFIVGFILGVSEESVLIKEVDQYGSFDGFTLTRLNDIYRIAYAGKYENKLMKLYSQKKDNTVFMPDARRSLEDSFLLFGSENHHLISVLMNTENGETVSGYIDSFTSENLILNCIDEDGQKNGKTIIDRGQIIRIACLSAYEIMLSSLYEQSGGMRDGFHVPQR